MLKSLRRYPVPAGRLLARQLITALVLTGCGPGPAAPVSGASTGASPTASPNPAHMSASKTPPPAAASGTPATPTASATAASTAPASAAESGTLVLAAAGGTARFKSLTILVVDVTEKLAIEGEGIMRITLRLSAPGHQEDVQVTSSEPKLEWHGFELEYQGGWRDEVRLTVKSAP